MTLNQKHMEEFQKDSAVIEQVTKQVQRHFPNLRTDYSLTIGGVGEGGETFVEYYSEKVGAIYLFVEKAAENKPVIGGLMFNSRSSLLWISAQTIDELLSIIQKAWEKLNNSFGGNNQLKV